jgi:hypothetical protein
MTKTEYLALAEARFEAINKLQQHTDFYTYEQQFDQIWIDLGRAVLEQSVGKIPKDSRKKTGYVLAMENCK